MCHPLPLFLWPALFSLLCYLSFLSVFYPTLFYLFLLSCLCPNISSTPPPPLFYFTLRLLSLSSFILSHFLSSSLLIHSLRFFLPTPFAYGSWQCSPSILAQAGGRWVSPWLHTCTYRHMHMCVHKLTCWGWWLMSNARLSASMPIRAAQETSLGLLATAWHWLQYLPACLFHSGKNLKSWGYTLLNIDNHRQWLGITDET